MAATIHPSDSPQRGDRNTVQGDNQEIETPAVTVDVVILTVRDHRLEVLLVRRDHPPFEGSWALPGRFVRLDESLEDAARRKLLEETGAQDVYLEQLYTFGEPQRDPRMRVVTVVYYALIRPDLVCGKHGTPGAQEAQLFPAYAVPPLAFDHDRILRYSLQRLRGKLEYTTIGFQLLGREFTLSELQEVYEAILNKRLDKRNFRKKLLMTHLLEPTQHTKMAGQHRPALLYRFNPRAASE